MIIGYIRVSTQKQNLEMQQDAQGMFSLLIRYQNL